MPFDSARSDLFRYNPVFCATPRRTGRVELYIDASSEAFAWLVDRRDEIEA